MKVGIRTPSPTRSVKARTTGRIKRAAKSTYNPVYGMKGIGYLKDPERAIKNKIYHKMTYDPLSSMKKGMFSESKGVIVPIILFYIVAILSEAFAVFMFLSYRIINILSICASIICYLLFVLLYIGKYE